MTHACTVEDLRLSAVKGYQISLRLAVLLAKSASRAFAYTVYTIWKLRQLDLSLTRLADRARSSSADHIPADRLLKAAADLDNLCVETRDLLDADFSHLMWWPATSKRIDNLAEATEILEDVAEAWKLASSSDFRDLVSNALSEIDEHEAREHRSIAAV